MPMPPEHDVRGLGYDARPEQARAVRAWLDKREASDIDLVAQGETPTADPAAASATAGRWAEAGCS